MAKLEGGGQKEGSQIYRGSHKMRRQLGKRTREWAQERQSTKQQEGSTLVGMLEESCLVLVVRSAPSGVGLAGRW